MSDSVIDRDEQQQRRFADFMLSFENEMRACCRSLKGHIAEAQDNVQADNARGALQYLMELVEEIESELPGAVEFGEKQLTLAKRIEEASGFRFSRH